jgi:hypothetical protein
VEERKRQMDERVKYYGANDMMSGYFIDKAATRLKKFNPTRKVYSINEIIELYNILKYIQAGAYLKSWTDAEKLGFHSYESGLNRTLSRYFQAITGANFSRIAKQINQENIRDFISLYGLHRLNDRVSERQFKNFILVHNISARTLAGNEQIVKMYPDLAKELITANSSGAEILLDKYVAAQERADRLFIPSSLTSSEKGQLIDAYIDNADVNLNYLRLIKDVQNTKDFGVSDKTKLKAKRKEQEVEEELFKGASVHEFGYKVVLDGNQSEEVVYINNADEYGKSFSKKWLEDDTSNSQILHNFIHLFEYVDDSLRIDLLSDSSDMGTFEGIMGVKARKDYPVSEIFRLKTVVSTMEMDMYYEFLKFKKIRLEDVISWFFSTYLSEEFNVNDFKITMPGETLTYKEKCQALLPELENILKQFKLYVEDGGIDFELLRLSNDQINYTTIPSLIERKYIYANPDNKEIEPLINMLFSTQSSLGYISESLSGDTLFGLLTTHNVKYSDFHSYQTDQIDFLIKQGILKKDKQYIRFKNHNRVVLLSKLFGKGFINYSQEITERKQDADKMLKAGLLIETSTLLSLQESSFYNYNLNKAQYTNGLNIRNQYSHGNQPDSDDANKHKENYLIILKLLILAIIKINDEFCLIDDK